MHIFIGFIESSLSIFCQPSVPDNVDASPLPCMTARHEQLYLFEALFILWQAQFARFSVALMASAKQLSSSNVFGLLSCIATLPMRSTFNEHIALILSSTFHGRIEIGSKFQSKKQLILYTQSLQGWASGCLWFPTHAQEHKNLVMTRFGTGSAFCAIEPCPFTLEHTCCVGRAEVKGVDAREVCRDAHDSFAEIARPSLSVDLGMTRWVHTRVSSGE